MSSEIGEQKKGGNENSSSFCERPRICLFDVLDDCVQSLKTRGFNYYSGTLGALVNVPNERLSQFHYCRHNFDFPLNLHEYDIAVIDLQNPRTVDHVYEDHSPKQAKQREAFLYVCAFPATVFDPRALSASILKSPVDTFKQKESVIIVFAANDTIITYDPIVVTPKGMEPPTSEIHSLYDFYRDIPPNRNMSGKDTTVVISKDENLGQLLERHNLEATYSIVFDPPPTDWMSPQKDFRPLMKEQTGGIVAFAHLSGRCRTFFFPQIKRKAPFLIELFETVLPQFVPSLFPCSTKFIWLGDPQYMLPKENILLQERKKLKEDYEKSLTDINAKIEENRQQFGFLHDLLTQSGSDLVKTVQKYLWWLGFDNAVNVDETNPNFSEEDLRIETDNELIVIEVKGLEGTSSDSQCSQINKIRHRRERERQAFDVTALYLVNHQRYLPPEKRRNPPFNEIQIRDAKNEKRGLLTTYDLFKLYFNVTNGLISKEDARKALSQTGLIQFQPSQAIKVETYEIYYKGDVIVLHVDGFHLKTGMSLVLDDAGRWRSARILEIQIDGESVDEASSGEVGIKLSEKVSKGMELWVKNDL